MYQEKIKPLPIDEDKIVSFQKLTKNFKKLTVHLINKSSTSLYGNFSYLPNDFFIILLMYQLKHNKMHFSDIFTLLVLYILTQTHRTSFKDFLFCFFFFIFDIDFCANLIVLFHFFTIRIGSYRFLLGMKS